MKFRLCIVDESTGEVLTVETTSLERLARVAADAGITSREPVYLEHRGDPILLGWVGPNGAWEAVK